LKCLSIERPAGYVSMDTHHSVLALGLLLLNRDSQVNATADIGRSLGIRQRVSRTDTWPLGTSQSGQLMECWNIRTNELWKMETGDEEIEKLRKWESREC
jgi:hypothetical protein